MPSFLYSTSLQVKLCLFVSLVPFLFVVSVSKLSRARDADARTGDSKSWS